MGRDVGETVRRVLRERVELARDPDALADGDDLFDAGLTSHGSVELMLALEDELGIVFPDETLTRSTFSSIGSIAAAVASVRAPAAGAG